MFVSQMMTRQSIVSVFQKQVDIATYEEVVIHIADHLIERLEKKE